MAGYCSTGQSPQRAVVLNEEKEKMPHANEKFSQQKLWGFVGTSAPVLCVDVYPVEVHTILCGP
jgi:hypothetical protein